MIGTRLALPVALVAALVACGCEESSSSAAEPAPTVASSTSSQDLREEPATAPEPAPTPPEAEPEEAPPARRGMLTELIVTLKKGESRETMERIAVSVGARITMESELGDSLFYGLHVDVDTYELRDAILDQIAAEPTVEAVGADMQLDFRWIPGSEHVSCELGDSAQAMELARP